ncbi:MAG: hypothetical protein GY798_14035 [Hyphomicrobiales bacterium]|nr:hypothetical protein [Hyphomicrobiales bacterium]
MTLLPLIACTLAVTACQTIGPFDMDAGETHLPAVRQARLDMPAVRDVLQGALRSLHDMQIRDRAGRGSSAFDWCGDRRPTGGATAPGDGSAPEEHDRASHSAPMGDHESCRSRAFVSLPVSQRLHAIPAFGPDVRNVVGEWNAVLGVVPKIPGNNGGRLFFGVQDPNMFVSAAVGYPLLLFEAPAGGALSDMLRLTHDSIARYRRGEGYAFWPQQSSITAAGERYDVTHPLNVSAEDLESSIRMYAEDPDALGAFTSGMSPNERYRFLRWVRQLLDDQANPHGIESATNIPADVDDTSTAVAFGIVYRTWGGRAGAGDTGIDQSTLSALPRFRDLDRLREDGQDAWKGADSGAFLTWLKDEETPAFSRPDQGIIPLGVNNVDCVVNANALLALGLAGQTHAAGYDDALRLMVRAVESEAWPQCGLYYPQTMIFPYTLSRAWRDGRVRSPELRSALTVLIGSVLEEQSPDGWFDGGPDHSRDLSTALAVVTLLNLGEDIATSAGLRLTDYRNSIVRGLDYLYRHRRVVRVKHQDTLTAWPLEGRDPGFALSWEPGVFFADSFWNLAQWRSEAYTTAIVLEAFARYAMAYDRHPSGILDSPRLKVDEAGTDFRIEAARTP